MTIYILAITFILTILAVVGQRKGIKNLALSISFILLWAIASFRSLDVGVDTQAYAYYFQDVSSGKLGVLEQVSIGNLFSVDGLENGYKLYNFAVSLITDNFTVLLAIAYAFIFYSFYRFIKKYSDNAMLSLAIYIPLFFFTSMNHFRQAIALAILTWGYGYIRDRKFFKYLLVVLAATLIHQASIVMIGAYFVYGKKINIKSGLVYGGATILLLLLVNPLILLLASDNTRYEGYIDNINSFQIGSYIIAIVYLLLLLAVFLLYRQTKSKKVSTSEKKVQYFYLHMMIISVLVAIISIKVNALSRFISYFMIYSVISIPYFVSINENLKLTKSLALLLIIGLFSYAFITMLLRPEWLGVWPYRMVF